MRACGVGGDGPPDELICLSLGQGLQAEASNTGPRQHGCRSNEEKKRKGAEIGVNLLRRR